MALRYLKKSVKKSETEISDVRIRVQAILDDIEVRRETAVLEYANKFDKDISSWDFSNVTTMEGMFITSIATKDWRENHKKFCIKIKDQAKEDIYFGVQCRID